MDTRWIAAFRGVLAHELVFEHADNYRHDQTANTAASQLVNHRADVETGGNCVCRAACHRTCAAHQAAQDGPATKAANSARDCVAKATHIGARQQFTCTVTTNCAAYDLCNNCFYCTRSILYVGPHYNRRHGTSRVGAKP